MPVSYSVMWAQRGMDCEQIMVLMRGQLLSFGPVDKCASLNLLAKRVNNNYRGTPSYRLVSTMWIFQTASVYGTGSGE
jgi:hypothetical protein